MKFEEYLSSLRNKTVAVIGIGVSNRPLIELLLSRGVAVTACDKKDRATLGALAEELHIPIDQLTSTYFQCLDEVNNIWQQLMSMQEFEEEPKEA